LTNVKDSSFVWGRGGVEQEEKWPNSQFKDHFPDWRSMGSRPLFWNLTPFPPLNLGTIKNLIFLPCFGHEGCKSPVQTAFLRHSPPQKDRRRRFVWGGFAPQPPPPQIPYVNALFPNSYSRLVGFLTGRTVLPTAVLAGTFPPPVK
jgi:hypothetical protein